MKRIGNVFVCIGISLLLLTPAGAAPPPITGTPTIDQPNLLAWPTDVTTSLPDLSEPTANTLRDIHAHMDACDIVLSSAGNFHMALRDLWYDVYLPSLSDLTINNWMYTTSPPISPDQIANQHVSIGNMASGCRPQVVIGPMSIINALQTQGVLDGSAVPIIKNQGKVILVRFGNPKNITSIFDLGKNNVRVVTPNPDVEQLAFNNYSNTIYNIALDQSGQQAADDLFNAIFNSSTPTDKWLAGSRIHHRETPWSIAFGKADAGIFFYHLALYAKNTFPNKFDIVPLGGTVQNPQPLPGNSVSTFYAARIVGNWTSTQMTARERLMDALQSTDFTNILLNYGLVRP